MRAAVLSSFGGSFELREVPDPVAAPGEVVVDIVACGAGLTLEHVRNGVMGGTPPFIMGHEFAGRISSLGEGVRGWAIGDPVTATFYLTCGQCDMCARGHETLCRNFDGWIGAARDGAFAERIAVPARNLVRVPDGVGLDIAGVVVDAVATPYHAVEARLGVRAGQRVGVIGGGGGIGVHALGVVRAFGGEAIALERDPAKLAALEAGGHADLIVDTRADGWAERLREGPAGGLDAVIDTVGTSETLSVGASLLAARGALVVLGLTAGAKLALDPFAVLLGEHAILGTRYCNRAEIAASLDLVARGRVPVVVGARFPLDEIEAAFEAIRANAVFGRILIDVSR
jgi:propanol-preferring alcohol dehydrogenase